MAGHVSTALRLEPALDLVGAELERHAAQAERDMARMRKALHRVASARQEDLQGAPLVLARKAALAAAAADSALVRLSDAARGGLDFKDVLDLLLAARSTLDALRESADLVELLVSAVALPPSGEETWPEPPTTPPPPRS